MSDRAFSFVKLIFYSICKKLLQYWMVRHDNIILGTTN